jgi:hypothetical protein
MADVQILDKDWVAKSKPLFWLDKDWVAKSKPNPPVWKGKKPNRN